MEITVAGQTWLFLLSVALGAALGVCYDVFRDSAHRLPAIPPWPSCWRIHPFFACRQAGATLRFPAHNGHGQLRAFFLIGELVGFSLYHCTLGALLIGAAKGSSRPSGGFLG